MPPDFDDDLEAQLDAALKRGAAGSGSQKPAENLIAVPAPDAGEDFDADLESQLDEALTKPHDVTQLVRSALSQPTGSGTPDDPTITHPDKVNELPLQSITGDAPKPAPKRWYDSFLPNKNALVAGAAQGATLNFGDEGAAALSTGLSSLLPGVRDPDGFKREYKAGSQYADVRNVMDADNQRLRAESPAAYLSGQLLGAAPAAIATAPAFGAASPMFSAGKALPYAEAALAGGTTGALAGAGDAKPGERLENAAFGAAEGAIAGPVLHGTGEMLKKAAQGTTNVANRLLVQTFMTPAQRSRYALAKGGAPAITQLGSDARDAGLFGGPLRQLLPTRARNVANNAVEIMGKSGKKIEDFENGLSQRGINPDVDIQPIVQDLRGAASSNDVPAIGSDDVVGTLNRQADMLEQPEFTSVAGKIERPPALPEWSLGQSQAPKYGARIEPVQEPLPGTELPPIRSDRPLPPPPEPEQLTLPTPRAMPDKQLDLDLSSQPPPRPEPTQFEMSLPRQQPTTQVPLPLEPQQSTFMLPPAEARKMNSVARPAQHAETGQQVLAGGAAQEPLFGATDPVRPQVPAIQSQPAPQPEQLGMTLPHRQMPLDLDLSSRPNRFVPTERPASQMPLPVQQELALPPRAPREQPTPAPTRASANPLAGRQESLAPPDVLNPNRGPQPELSTPLDDATAQVTRDSLPFSDAMKLKRFLGGRINWMKNPNAAVKQADDAVAKSTWKGVSEQIDKSLTNHPDIDQTELGGYNKARKDYHTAATAFDPALKMAEREGEVGLGAKDMLAASAFGADPLTGGLAAMANKQLSGMLPSTAATGMRTVGGLARLGAAGTKSLQKVSPIAFARQQNPDANDAEIKRKANEQVKKDLQKFLEQP